MRIAVVVAGLALAAGAAPAADLNDPVWAQAPDRADWAKAYPAHAAQTGVSGAVKLRCAASGDGSLQNCAVIEEAPAGQGFGAAALLLSSGMHLRPTAQNGEPVAGHSVVVPVKFDPSLLQSATTITNPDWLRKPTNDELIQYWPAEAKGAAGKAAITCVITNRGLLEKCAIVEETPTGHGFGGAALAMSAMFMMRPMSVDGLPVGGGKVTIPINFKGGGFEGSGLATVRVISSAPWLATPTADQMSAAYPKAAVGKAATGHVVLRCGMKMDGALGNCDTVSEAPLGEGFARAALGLTKDFQVNINPQVDRLNGLKVDVPFDFRDPSKPAPQVEIYDPTWVRTVDPSGAAKLFPDAAAKAGYKQGRATLNCGVAHDGSLTDCSVVTEDPANMGFGDAALEIASVLQMNPWTSQGAPVDGGRIELPVRLVLPDQPPPATAPAASQPSKP